MEAKKKDIRILIVDDEASVREIMSYILEKRGFIIENSQNGREALKEVARKKPNIIILDFAMPEMDGLQTCMRLRENPDTQDIPIIFLSAQKHIAEVVRNMPGAAIEYIEKPCNIEHLFERIDNLITKQKPPQ